jgi:RNA polymerase sigma factor (sigma-70 family)
VSEHSRLITARTRVRLRLASDDRLVAFVRRGDIAAFEVLYERHSRGLLSFCLYMLGSRPDAEDAVQTTFASAYRALRADGRPVALRAWLFTIARNDCLSIMRRRRPTVELNGELALRGDPLKELELREEVRHMLEGIRELPERQRAALVLAELHGLSQVEIGGVLGVEPEQVKAYVYQARSNLVSARRARETDCREIREELATARGAALLRGRLRRHVRSCDDCRVYADGLARQRHQLGALLPLVPSLVLKYRALEEALGIGGADPATYAGGATVGGAVAGGAAEIAGGGVKALAVKLAAGVALLGASAGVGASVIGVPITPEEQAPVVASAATSAQRPLLAFSEQTSTAGGGGSGSALAQRTRGRRGGRERGAQEGQSSTSPTQGSPRAGGGGDLGTGLGTLGDTGGELRGKREGGQPQGEGSPPKAANSRGSEEERQKKNEAEARLGRERQQESEADQRQSQERQKESEEHRLQSQERLKQAEERQLKRQERAREREEPPPVGVSRPPRSEQQLTERREKRERRHKERLEAERLEAEEAAK